MIVEHRLMAMGVLLTPLPYWFMVHYFYISHCNWYFLNPFCFKVEFALHQHNLRAGSAWALLTNRMILGHCWKLMVEMCNRCTNLGDIFCTIFNLFSCHQVQAKLVRPFREAFCFLAAGAYDNDVIFILNKIITINLSNVFARNFKKTE